MDITHKKRRRREAPPPPVSLFPLFGRRILGLGSIQDSLKLGDNPIGSLPSVGLGGCVNGIFQALGKRDRDGRLVVGSVVISVRHRGENLLRCNKMQEKEARRNIFY